MHFIFFCGLFIGLVFRKAKCLDDDLPDVCKPGPKGRLPWILYVRGPDYGWGEHTHRANIAVAINKHRGEEGEMKKMGLQLDMEITRALLRSETSSMHDSDLALYIHALLATQKNPYSFHGTDLVAELLNRVEVATARVNPFLVLALCNSHAVKYKHLDKIIRNFNRNFDRHKCQPEVESREIQSMALTMKALACAAEVNTNLNKFSSEIKNIIGCLSRKYNRDDGSFGSVYTTSLAVQALTAIKQRPYINLVWWDEDKSIKYLETESEIDVNLLKAYYIEMALNADRTKFVKDLYMGIPQPDRVSPIQNMHYVQYTVKESLRPDKYHTLTLNVANTTNFYEIMQMASNLGSSFKFKTYENNNGDPVVYSVAGIPNDVEENKFWRLCSESKVDHQIHKSEINDILQSPAEYQPLADDHLIYLYGNERCSALKQDVLYF